MTNIKSLIFLIIHILNTIESANILAVLAVYSHSHHLVQMEVIKGLLIAKHKVTIFSSKELSYEHKNLTYFHLNEMIKVDGSIMVQIKSNNKFKAILNGFNYAVEAKLNQLRNENFTKLFKNPKNETFDLIYLECEYCVHTILAEALNIPIVLATSSDANIYKHRIIGNNVQMSTQTDPFVCPGINGKIGFVDRIVLFYPFTEIFYQSVKLFQKIVIWHLIKSSFPNNSFNSSERNLESRLRLAFAFTNWMTSNPIPVLPIYHHVGSIHIKPPNDLDPNMMITKFLEKSTKGVIVMSFGSFENQLSDDLFKKFLDTFKDLQFNIIWKTNPDQYKNLKVSENILFQDWLPLSDVLAHKNVKLLIGHGGLRTIEEAINREIPMILFPLALDQPLNALLMDSHKIAINMDLNKFTQESLTAAIYELMKDEYRENIHKIRELIADRMSSSLETAVDNIEYLLKHNETFEYQLYPGREFLLL